MALRGGVGVEGGEGEDMRARPAAKAHMHFPQRGRKQGAGEDLNVCMLQGVRVAGAEEEGSRGLDDRASGEDDEQGLERSCNRPCGAVDVRGRGGDRVLVLC